jgi:spore coat polysaccharide biosynthesis predicted glycosyltransferase SpsG
MAQADLAISAAGSTCWELCLLGLPAVLLDLANNQTPIAIEMHRRGCALHVGRATDLSQKELTAPVRDLLTSKELRTSFSSRCRQLVDGLGADRVLSAMFAIEGKPVFAGTCQ